MSTIYLPDTTGLIHVRKPGKQKSDVNFRSYVVGALFFFCLTFIGSVSAWDAWLVEANAEILNSERNPICGFLIWIEPESKIYFFIGKAVSSACVLGILTGLYRSGYRYAMTVAIAVSLFQLGLLIHLYLSDNQCGGLPNFALLFRETEEQVFAFRFR
jgi:hypothetical protein